MLNRFKKSLLLSIDRTFIQSIDSNKDFFHERYLEPEVAVESRKRKRKAEQMSSKRFRNKNLRMLGHEYIGFRKTGEEKFYKTL